MWQLYAFIALLYILGLMILKLLKRYTPLFDVEHHPERPWVHECDQCGWKRDTLYRPKNDGVYGWVCGFCQDRNAKA